MRRRVPMFFLAAALLIPTMLLAEDPPAVETGTATSGIVTTADGVPLAYDLRGEGEPTLVFVHCWACDRQVWRQQVDVFAEDHRVVAMDLAGHGASGAERETWTLDGLAGDVVQLVETLELDDFVFVGHSMGGPVALLAATHLQGRVDGLVCVDTLHDLEMKPPPEQAKAWYQMFEDDFEGSVARMTSMTLPGDSNQELRDWVVARAAETDRAAALALMKDFASLELSAEAKEAGVPIRCINAATMQQQMPDDAAERNRQFADYEVTVMEDVGHFLLLEKPEEFNQLLREAIASIEAASTEAASGE